MSLLRKSIALVAAVAAVAGLAACDRSITTTEVALQNESCLACHIENNDRFVSANLQWENSKHASGDNIDHNTDSCNICHTSEGFVARMSGDPIPAEVTNPTVISCYTCHAPHFELRVTDPQPLQDGTTIDILSGNLCVACHQSRRNVNTYITDPVTTLSTRWGPHHSNQADALFGSNGYEYSNYTYIDFPVHRTIPVNGSADGCLNCHFKATSNNVVGGHAYSMACDDGADGILNTAACAPCHGSLDDFNYKGIQDSVAVLLDTLRTELITAGLIDSTDHALAVDTSADSAGAVWNYLFAQEDRSHGVHNSKYTIGLVESAIRYMQGTLPQTSPPAAARRSRPGASR